MLESRGEAYADRALSWSDARLGVYADLFDDETLFIGIELTEDVEPPKHYRALDHHGAFSHRPSALEQVAALLNEELDRYAQLVAANDRGYVRAMRCLGASEEEIAKIRRADRRAQGVSEAEEVAAESEMAGLKRLESGLYVVDTALEHFSPLVDRMEKRPLLVRGERQWSFYGDSMAVTQLAEAFDGAAQTKEAYYGGNPPGFFGLTADWFVTHSKEETMAEIEKALMDKKAPLYSYHTFMFPFRFETMKHAAFDASGAWEEKRFEIDAAERFNEKNYFYGYVHEVLFAQKSKATNPVSRYFEYRVQSGHFRITAKNRTYALEIDGISLRLFHNRIAILSFNLINRAHRDPQSALAINDFGRRLYPQFLGEEGTQASKDAFLPQCVEVVPEGEEAIRENFSRYDDLSSLQGRLWHAPAHIAHFLNDIEGVDPILDDRMYVLCHLLDSGKSAALKTAPTEEYRYETDDFWYRYIFVDGGEAMCQNLEMKRALIKRSTYTRWSDYGTLYGITRYSFMLLSDGSGFSRDVLNAHMRTLYFQMATLLLAYRAMALHFSEAIADAKNDDEKAQDVFENYLDFQNRIYFREVTAQEQGIELFSLGRERMRLDRQIEELDHDIAELHAFVDTRREKRRNDRLETLSELGAIFLPPSLIAGIYGVNTVDFAKNALTDWLTFGTLSLSALLGFGAVKLKAPLHYVFSLALILLFAYAVLGFPTAKSSEPPQPASHLKEKNH